MTDEPRRLLDPGQATGALRDALELAREDVPTDEQLASLASKLAPLLGGGGGAGGGGGGISLTGGLSTTAKLAALLATATLTTATLWWALGPGPSAQSPDADWALGPGPSAQSPDAGWALGSGPSAQSPDADAALGPGPTAPSPIRDEGSDAEEELRLLREAQDALEGRPRRALAVAGEHARRFPRGMLAQEREVIAIDALVRLGRNAQARARAERFRRRNPESALNERITTLVGAE